jgi:hypothetical protein
MQICACLAALAKPNARMAQLPKWMAFIALMPANAAIAVLALMFAQMAPFRSSRF